MSNKLYSIQRAIALSGGLGFTNIAEHILSTPPENVYLDATATNRPSLFYRVRVEEANWSSGAEARRRSSCWESIRQRLPPGALGGVSRRLSGLPCEARFWERKLGLAKAHYR